MVERVQRSKAAYGDDNADTASSRSSISGLRRVASLQELTSPAIVNNMTRNTSVADLRAPVDVDDAMTSNMPRVSSLKDLMSPVLMDVVKADSPKKKFKTYNEINNEKMNLMEALDDIQDLLSFWLKNWTSPGKQQGKESTSDSKETYTSFLFASPSRLSLTISRKENYHDSGAGSFPKPDTSANHCTKRPGGWENILAS